MKTLPVLAVALAFGFGIALGVALKPSHPTGNTAAPATQGGAAKTTGTHPVAALQVLPETNLNQEATGTDTRDFSTLLQAALHETNQRKRFKTLSSLADRVELSKIPEALAAMDSLNNNDKQEVRQWVVPDLLSRWGGADPQAPSPTRRE